MKKLLMMDPIVLACSLLLICIGNFTLYSLTLTNTNNEFFKNEFVNQLIFALTGIVIAAVVFSLNAIYLKFRIIIIGIFVLTVLPLLYVLFFAPKINEVTRWIVIGNSITIQPSEFTKLAIIIIAASCFSTPIVQTIPTKSKIISFLLENKNTLLGIGLCSVLIGLVIIQPSLSVGIILMMLLSTILFASIENKVLFFATSLSFITAIIASQNVFFELQLPVRVVLFVSLLALYAAAVYVKRLHEGVIFVAIAAGVLLGSVFVPVTWNYALRDYQRDRIEAYFDARDEKRDKRDEGFQQEQAKTSIGAGQFFGQGYSKISDNRLSSLPEATTDFIFAVFSLKFGFLGSIIVILLYLLLILRLFFLADKTNDRFSSLLLIGIGALVLIQFFSNIGMNLDILPVGGSTLPFMSAGGSSLISMIIAISLAQNIIATNKLEKNNYRKQDKVVINGWNA